MTKLSFSNKSNAFYTTLKTAVEEHFSNHQLKKTGNWKLYAKTGNPDPVALLIYCSLLLLFSSDKPIAAGSPQHFFRPPRDNRDRRMRLPGYCPWQASALTLCTTPFTAATPPQMGERSDGTDPECAGRQCLYLEISNTMFIHHTYTNVDGLDDEYCQKPLHAQLQPLKE